jgi:hypothetical protein
MAHQQVTGFYILINFPVLLNLPNTLASLEQEKSMAFLFVSLSVKEWLSVGVGSNSMFVCTVDVQMDFNSAEERIQQAFC